MTLAELITWTRERWEAETPLRLHRRAIWADDSGGSALGSPAWANEFKGWIEGSPDAARNEDVVGEHCIHPRQSAKDRKHLQDALLNARPTDGLRCPDCDETGLRAQTRRFYRWPMRATLARIADERVPKGRPPHDAVIWQLALNEWSAGAAAASLARDYPLMADAATAHDVIVTALSLCRRKFREEAPSRVIDKSQAQVNAEAAAA